MGFELACAQLKHTTAMPLMQAENNAYPRRVRCHMNENPGLHSLANECCKTHHRCHLQGPNAAFDCLLGGFLKTDPSTSSIACMSSLAAWSTVPGSKPRALQTFKLASTTSDTTGCCIFPGCTRRASYNMKGQSPGGFCEIHAQPGHEDVTHITCWVCKRTAMLDTTGTPGRRFCSPHKQAGMLNITLKVQGNPGSSCCSAHNWQEMVQVTRKERVQERCKPQVRTDVEGTLHQLFCTSHNMPGMVNVSNSAEFASQGR